MNRLGIDIGSKTIKLVLLSGEDGSVLYSNYIRHRSRVQSRLVRILRDCLWQCGPVEVAVTVTGSAGMRVAELFGIPHVQEVVALKRAVEALEPGSDCILEMGGEDTKLVYLTGAVEQRMNTVCAGGTGGFIDMMASLMGVRVELMSSLARRAQTTYTIASRCAVFAKSDVRPLLNSGARREDIARSVLEAVCTQAIAGLSAGRPISGKVVLLGGPFNHIPALRDCFVSVSGLAEEDVVVPQDAHLFVAHGAALCDQASEPMTLRTLVDSVVDTRFATDEGIGRLEPLFSTEEDYEEFCDRHAGCQIPQVSLSKASPSLFVGIDAGSTTMKLAVVDESGALCGYEYNWNHGDVTKSLPWMLMSQYRNINSTSAGEKVVRRSCIIGYGEDFCRAAYRIDMGEVETVAHLRAAQELEPDVDFLMDIGGQDIKCFYVKDGVINDIVLNEACSSGCGSLFDDIARSMNRTKETFASEALFSKAPVDLGTRCSTFMDSRVKHAQKDGAEAGDIAAGVAYATARNALYKVVRRADFSSIGDHVVVQGGAFANDALLRAFELETGCEVKRPDLAEIMGAWGAALLARDEWLALRAADPQRAARVQSGLLGEDELRALEIEKLSVRCDQCTNACKLVVTRFSGATGAERVYVMGNKCEKGAAAYGGHGHSSASPPNMYRVKRDLLDQCAKSCADAQVRGPVVGIPKVLSLFESFPFWATFFTRLGFEVRTLPASDDAIYRAGMGAIPSEGACYPSKIVYGHVAQLANDGADIVFLPYMGTEFARYGLCGEHVREYARDCPLVENMPQMVADNMRDDAFAALRLMSPDLRNARGLNDVSRSMQAAFEKAGFDVESGAICDAIAEARDAYRVFHGQLERVRVRTSQRIANGEFEGALVIGHPYHADLGICHGVDLLLGKMGYAVLDSVGPVRPGDGEQGYVPNAALLSEIEQSESASQLQCVVLRSFGCGLDALVADEAYEKLRRQGRIYAELKLDQIVDLAAVRIRLRSLAYAMHKRKRGADVLAKENWRLVDDEQAMRLVAAQAEYDERVRRGDCTGQPGSAHIKRISSLHSRRRVVKKAKQQAQEESQPDGASVEKRHAEQVLLMWKLGYRFIQEQADGDVVFEGKWEKRSFAGWNAVERYLADQLVEIERRDKRIEEMAKRGYSHIGFRPTLRGTDACIGFMREGSFEWFDAWEAVDDFLLAHPVDELPPETREALRKGAPVQPLPPGVTTQGHVAGLSGEWGSAVEYASDLRARRHVDEKEMLVMGVNGVPVRVVKGDAPPNVPPPGTPMSISL